MKGVSCSPFVNFRGYRLMRGKAVKGKASAAHP